MGALGRGRGSVGGCSSYVKFLAHVQQPHKRGYRKYKKKKNNAEEIPSKLDEKCEGGGGRGEHKKLGGRLVKINERRYGRGPLPPKFLVSVGKRRHLETAKSGGSGGRGGITTQNKWTK